MIGKKLKILKESTTKEEKNIGNNLGERRTRTRNRETKDRRVEQKRWNRQSTKPIQWIVKFLEQRPLREKYYYELSWLWPRIIYL